MSISNNSRIAPLCFFILITCFIGGLSGFPSRVIEDAKKGDAEAQFILGLEYDLGDEEIEKDDKKAAIWFRKSADQGHAEAQYFLGVAYTIGRGVNQNHEEAARWYRRAADQGLADAQLSLGIAYNRGDGVENNRKKGNELIIKAAEQGLARGQFTLGLKYAVGDGTLQDYVLAHKWLNLATYNGRGDATKYLRALEKKMTVEQIAEAQKAAREWLKAFEAKQAKRIVE